LPSQSEQAARIIVVMGVSGCGKTSIGTALARERAVPFLDGDDFHPQVNIDKMRSGQPLDDTDRWPWLAIFGRALRDNAEKSGQVFAACSALKRTYRDVLRHTAQEPILFILLDGSKEVIGERMAARTDHFMPPDLLDSQLATLEYPNTDELSATISVGQSLEQIQEQCSMAINSH